MEQEVLAWIATDYTLDSLRKLFFNVFPDSLLVLFVLVKSDVISYFQIQILFCLP